MRCSVGRRQLLLLLLAALPVCARGGGGGGNGSADSRAGPPGHGPSHWSYTDKAQWASDFVYCGGHMQSPINIDTSTTLFAPELTPLQLYGYNLLPEQKLSLRNNGHTIVLSLPANMSLSGGGFLEAYRAAQLHLHWGSKAGPGSEHTVDGHRYAGEIHVVHYSTRFRSIREAAREPGGLAVLAAFLQVGSEENEAYQHIFEDLDDIHEEGEETLIAGFDIAQLLPANLSSYFHYNGSLTTPPCYQTVNWTVFNQTVLLSQEQISVLEESLLGGKEHLIQGNFRLPQSLHGRRVLASFPMPPASPFVEPPGPGEQVSSSFHTGDLLAILFGTLFGLTAVAFLLYVHKHRSQNPRLDAQAAKPSIIYVPATTEEHMG
ncbi:carbonic anhydrase 9 [Eublepharis macularius]|uniref:Carbonic anhydrase n=1 Tax=Eublepharis macularius TaxID=481883 RepID=A0AA97JNJ5_EUBMA|nr:carbonic anhydrase 9 [Eublepharis macularius]